MSIFALNLNYNLAILPTTDKIWLAVILLIIGLVGIIKGGDWFVDAAVWMAEVLHLPKFLIGATIVSVATTLPEMIVSIIAVAGANPNFSISIGNAVGSVTANTGLILAIGIIFTGGMINKKDFSIKTFLIIASTMVLLIFGLVNNKIGIIPSILLFILFVVHMITTIKAAKEEKEENENKEVDKSKKAIFKNIMLFLIGTCGIVFGADLLVENAKIVAKAIGISDGIIAITLVAIGTSLPELITTVTAVIKKQGSLGIGNVIGANIIDLVLILSVCSAISGWNLEVSSQSLVLDFPACLIVSIIATIPTIISGKFKKWQGFLLLAVYAIYITFAVIFFNK